MASSETTEMQAPSRGAILLAPRDNVAVAVTSLRQGDTISVAGQSITLIQPVSMGAKIAVTPLRAGDTVHKYAAPIGTATQNIAVGEHVHTHNLKSDYLPTYTRGAYGVEPT